MNESPRILFSCVVLLICGLGLHQVRIDAAPEQTSHVPVPRKAFIYQGAGSCAATGCHHAEGAIARKGHEYTVWAERDPHARAFRVLYDRRSQQIVRNLDGANAVPAHEHQLCIRCHSISAGANERGEHFSLYDGVSCESCHGPAEKWRTIHYLPGWRSMSEADKAGFGFRDTKDLAKRAQSCVPCHVGTAEQDVNHDLIAAGHPRLNFEFAAYFSILPRHWDEHADRKRHADFEARAWKLGQIETTRAVLDLLDSRAKKAAQGKVPWPEFAEYSCHACHQDLAANPPRRQPGRVGKLGSFTWGTWYAAIPARLSERRDAWSKLRDIMERPDPNARAVIQETETLRLDLDGWAARIRCSQVSRDNAHEWLKSLLGDGNCPSWDEACQYYLALAALHERAGLPESSKPKLKDLGRRLRQAVPNGYDSPRDFVPLSVDEIGHWLKLLER